MTGKESAQKSNRILDIAEKLQDYVGFLSKPITGSPSPAYVQLSWGKQPQTDPSHLSWVEIPGNAEAGRIPRHWPTAAIIGTPSSMLTKIQPRSTEVSQAVAYMADDDIVRVGVLPEGKRFGYASKAEHEAIAMRVGSGALRATMGLWLPESQQFIGPEEVVVLQTEVAIDKITRQYPDVILV